MSEQEAGRSGQLSQAVGSCGSSKCLRCPFLSPFLSPPQAAQTGALRGPLPLATKPYSDCRAVQCCSLITAGSGAPQSPAYSAHASALQTLVITICSDLYILAPPPPHTLPRPLFFVVVIHWTTLAINCPLASLIYSSFTIFHFLCILMPPPPTGFLLLGSYMLRSWTLFPPVRALLLFFRVITI